MSVMLLKLLSFLGVEKLKTSFGHMIVYLPRMDNGILLIVSSDNFLSFANRIFMFLRTLNVLLENLVFQNVIIVRNNVL